MSQEAQVESLKALQVFLPRNEVGLLTGIYRPDLLPIDRRMQLPGPTNTEAVEAVEVVKAAESGTVVEDTIAGYLPADLDLAFEPLQYDEGYPVQSCGKPFWEKLPYEGLREYKSFRLYLESGDPITSVETTGKSAGRGIRSIYTLAHRICKKEKKGEEQILNNLHNYATLYYWHPRVRAYDLYRAVQFKQQQEIRALELNTDHYARANKWIKRLEEYINDPEEFWDMLSPKVAIEFYKMLHGMQRVAIGLPPQGPATAKDESRGGQSVEFHFKQAAAREQAVLKDILPGQDISELDEFEDSREQENTKIVDKILTDANLTEAMQEIIIKVTNT